MKMETDTSSDQRPVVQASEILAKIERGEDVEYDGVIIEGDLDISGLDLLTERVRRTKHELQKGLFEELKVISSEIKIINSEIQGVNFYNAYFQKNIFFSGAKFVKGAFFKGAKFGKYADFKSADFGGNAIFQGVQFDRHAYFDGAESDGFVVAFDGAKFGNNASFKGAKFGKFVDFIGAKFGRNTDFEEAEFTGIYTYFSEAKFDGIVRFLRAEFSGYAEFAGAKFGNDASFKGAKFEGNVLFLGAEFDGDVNFGRIDFGGDVNFKSATFGGNAYFQGAKFDGHAYFEYDQFRQNVSFYYTKFGHPGSQAMVCRIAKRKMEERGNKMAADDYFYKEMEAIRMENGIKGTKKLLWPWKMQVSEWLKLVGSKVWRLGIYDLFEYVVIQCIFGYGVRPLRLFGFWILMAFAFASFYWYFDAVEGASAWFDYIWFSIATSATPGYALYNPIGHYKIVTGIQAIFGTFMWAAFIATFARKWQR